MKKINRSDIITVEQFAEEMKVSREMIETWKGKGMPVVKLGNRYLRIYRPSAPEWIVTFGQSSAREELG
jgi:phage terminase Nu1 subunit (DNA packaging protein)